MVKRVCMEVEYADLTATSVDMIDEDDPEGKIVIWCRNCATNRRQGVRITSARTGGRAG